MMLIACLIVLCALVGVIGVAWDIFKVIFAVVVLFSIVHGCVKDHASAPSESGYDRSYR
jgi:hypothetical protein